MSSPQFEAFLARIYTDEKARERFLAHPRDEAARAGLTETEIASLEQIDRLGLELAAQSLNGKRKRRFKRIFQR
jgi:hypothetical protein